MVNKNKTEAQFNVHWDGLSPEVRKVQSWHVFYLTCLTFLQEEGQKAMAERRKSKSKPKPKSKSKVRLNHHIL